MLCRRPSTTGYFSCYCSVIMFLECTCEVKISLSGGKHDPVVTSTAKHPCILLHCAEPVKDQMKCDAMPKIFHSFWLTSHASAEQFI